jgi:hypothetical protein
LAAKRQPVTDIDALVNHDGGLTYWGLSPFLRASIAGVDLRPVAQALLQSLADHPGNANLLMNLSLAAQCLNQRELGLAFQQEALARVRSYTVAASEQPVRLRLLVLVTPGSMQCNTPLECLLEVSDIELVFHFVTMGEPLRESVPAHDLLFVGISDSDANRALLQDLEQQLQGWAQPVLNAPQFLPLTGRDRASRLLQGVERLLVPTTQRVSRAELLALADGHCAPELRAAAGAFPFILRPVGSQAGANLQKIDSPSDVRSYLEPLDAQAFYLAPFVDYRDAKGLFRKIRIALVAGQPFVCHMAVSSNWMIHYVNAGMYAEAWKREEEARFMADFSQFARRHAVALQAISQRMQLEYLVMDCAETAAGDLLLFEIDHGGVVHAMDVESVFRYKNAHIHKVKRAFCELLYGLLPPAGAVFDQGKPSISKIIEK